VATFTGLWIVTLSEVEANAGQRGILLEPGVEPTVIPHLTELLAQKLVVNASDGVDQRVPLRVAALLRAAVNIRHLLQMDALHTNNQS
jgi:hypothetical protein